jgi:hypothetical protein
LGSELTKKSHALLLIAAGCLLKDMINSDCQYLAVKLRRHLRAYFFASVDFKKDGSSEIAVSHC